MDNYIQVEDGDEPYYLPVEDNNTVILETLQSAFPRSCGLCFYIKNKCFVVKLHRGILYPPREYWKLCYEPIYEDDDDYHNDYGEDNDYDDGYNVGVKPPEKEDINQLYFNLLNEKNDENDYDSDYDDNS